MTKYKIRKKSHDDTENETGRTLCFCSQPMFEILVMLLITRGVKA